MASRVGPRSVKDATRFTSTIPHAAAKSGQASTSSIPSPAQRAASRIPGESPEQRVRRLRQAHLAAQRAQVSSTDRIIDSSRRFFDFAHKFTIGGVILFTAVASVVSVYSVWDMLQYNRARRAEWVEAQKRLEADELATARVAYIKGTATEDQILLVEEANRHAEKTGVKLPPLLAPPEHRTHFEEHVRPAGQEQGESKGFFGFFSSSSASPDNTSVQEQASAASSPVQSIEETAKQAWETEMANQRKGGSLDQLGLDTSAQTPQVPTKKGWWPW